MFVTTAGGIGFQPVGSKTFAPPVINTGTDKQNVCHHGQLSRAAPPEQGGQRGAEQPQPRLEIPGHRLFHEEQVQQQIQQRSGQSPRSGAERR